MIQVAGKQFRTLDDEFFVNGKKVIAAYANGSLVYPEYAYLGRSSAKVENANYITYRKTENNEDVTDTGTYSIYIDMLAYSNIPLGVGTDSHGRTHLDFDTWRLTEAKKAIIRLSVTSSSHGCSIPPQEDNYFAVGASPVKPRTILKNPKYTLNNGSFVSYIIAAYDPQSRRITYTFDDRYIENPNMPEYPILTRWEPSEAFRHINYLFDRSKCDVKRVTQESFDESRRVWGYDTTVWVYEDAAGVIDIQNYYGLQPPLHAPIEETLYFTDSTVERI